MTTVVLSKPLKKAGDFVKELTFREPTAKDIIQAGLPYRFETDERGITARKVDTASIGLYIELLTNSPPFLVNQIGALDFMKCNRAVMDFFTEAAEPSSS